VQARSSCDHFAKVAHHPVHFGLSPALTSSLGLCNRNLPIWQWLRRLLRVLQLLSKEGREKWMDKLRSERQPLIHGFTDFHDMIFFMTSTS
jgi:hypothetical protein